MSDMPLHRIHIRSLPNNEGNLVALIPSHTKPNIEDVLGTQIGTLILTHGDCDQIRLVKITEDSFVLCCTRCLLRMKLTGIPKTLGDLTGDVF